MDFNAFRQAYPAAKNLTDQQIAINLIDSNSYGMSLDEFKKAYGAKLPFNVTPPPPSSSIGDTLKDVVKSVGSGVPAGYGNTILGYQKGLLGLGYLTGLAPDSVLRAAIPAVQKQQDLLDKTGASYQPTTGLGTLAKNITEMSVPLPGAGPLKTQMAVGAAGGALGTALSGAGPIGEAIGSALPYAAYATKKMFTPTAGVQRLTQAWNDMSVAEKNVMLDRMGVAQRHDIPLQIWQAAPEGSPLAELGKFVAGQEGASNIQKGLQRQADVVGMKGDKTGQVFLSNNVGDPMFGPYRSMPITESDLKQFHDSIMGVATNRFAPPGSHIYDLAQEQASKFGSVQTVSPDKQAVIDSLVTKQMSLPRGSPERDAINAQLKQFQDPNFQLPSTTQFVGNPNIENVGNAMNTIQEIGKQRTLGTSLTPVQGSTVQMTGAAKGVLTDKYPELAPLLKEYGTAKDLISTLTDSQSLAGRQASSGIPTQLSIQPGQEAAISLARRASFALLNPIRSASKKSLVNTLDQALGQPSLEKVVEMINTNPRSPMAQMWLSALLAPAKSGALSWPEGLPQVYGQDQQP